MTGFPALIKSFSRLLIKTQLGNYYDTTPNNNSEHELKLVIYWLFQ